MIALVTSTLVVALGSGEAQAAPAPNSSPYEASLVAMTNDARAGAGLPALTSQPGITDVARRWALKMGASGALSHNPDLAAQLDANGAAGWQSAAENVGVGSDAAGIFMAYMASAPHRANILRSSVTSIGIGAVRTSDGRVWDVMVFADAYNPSFGPSQTTADYLLTSGQPGAAPPAGPVFPYPTDGSPVGSFDTMRTDGPGSVTVSGWALDPDTAASTPVHVYVGRTGVPLTANSSRPDVGAVYRGYGDAHGFTGTVNGLSSGTYQVCAYAINATGPGGTVSLGCRPITLGGSPIGVMDSIAITGPGSVTVSGWALDPDTAAATRVDVYVGRSGVSLTAGGGRPDIGAAFPGYGDGHGFSGTVTGLASGTYQVCPYAINTAGAGGTTSLGCRPVTIGGTPVGYVESMTVSGGAVQIGGWALDPDTASSIPIHVYVDGVGVAYRTGVSRPDVAAAYPGFGSSQGFEITQPLAAGKHQVCVFAINVAGAGDNYLMNCRDVIR